MVLQSSETSLRSAVHTFEVGDQRIDAAMKVLIDISL